MAARTYSTDCIEPKLFKQLIFKIVKLLPARLIEFYKLFSTFLLGAVLLPELDHTYKNKCVCVVVGGGGGEWRIQGDLSATAAKQTVK